MQSKWKPNHPLILLWIFHSTLVLFLAYINPNHYTTIDSHYYLESAGNILQGHGYTIFEENEFRWNGTFPAGYSLAIAFVSFFTKTHVLWASKIVNIATTGIWFFFLNLWFGRKKSFLTGCILLLGCFLKLWAHSWSEPLFLVILFCWIYHFSRFSASSDLSISRLFSVLALGFLLMLVRYAGIFIIPLSVIYSVYYLLKRENDKSLIAAFLSVFWSAGFVFYLFLNYQNSEELYGGARFDENIMVAKNITSFAKGLMNKISFFGNFTFHSFEVFSFIGIAFQILLTALILKELGRKFVITKWVKHNFIIAFTYLIFLFILRIFSHFDEPGYRLLSPFTFLVLCGIIGGILDEQITIRLKNLLIIFIVISWVEIVPENDLKEKWSNIIRSIHNETDLNI